MYPKRAVAVTLPVHMMTAARERSKVIAFNIILRSADQSGTRFAPSLSMARPLRSHVDELEMPRWQICPTAERKAASLAIHRTFADELEAVSRRYMQEMIPFVGPQTDVMGPDMGTNEQVMAWFMDTTRSTMAIQ